MNTTTDFKAWLDEEGIECAEEMVGLYRTVAGTDSGYGYELKPAAGGKNTYLTGTSDTGLVLTPKSRDAFVRYMDSLYEGGVEAQAYFDHAMAKDD